MVEYHIGGLCENPPMPFSTLDAPAVARALAQIADRPGDLVDAYFERIEEVELPPPEETLGLRVRREEGLAVRLVRGGRTWLAARDAVTSEGFSQALRQVARALPPAPYPEPTVAPSPWREAPAAPELFDLPTAVSQAVRARHVAFPLRLTVKRHRRWLQVVGPQVVQEPESETFYSCSAEMPWGRYGTLLPALGRAAAEAVAASLVAAFKARQAGAPAAGRVDAVLAPAAAAVFLHEAVAHALETDILALGGNPEAAVGLELGAAELSVLDDPGASPGQTRRTSDDEGSTVCRRWLLRRGKVEQPLADLFWSRGSEVLLPGAGRRGSRHLPPTPRSSFLEVVPGETAEEDLLAAAEGGLYLPEARSGRLDPLTGRFSLTIPYARRIRGGMAADPVGPFQLRGTVATLLAAVAGIGREAAVAGAGWCAKDGQKLPVWAATPALRLAGVEVTA